MKYEGTIEALPDWTFSYDDELNVLISKWVIEALNDALPEAGSLWFSEPLGFAPLAIQFFLNLDDENANVAWTRPLYDLVLSEVRSACLPGGPSGRFHVSDQGKAYAAHVSKELRSIADQVDALMAEQNKSETGNVENTENHS